MKTDIIVNNQNRKIPKKIFYDEKYQKIIDSMDRHYVVY